MKRQLTILGSGPAGLTAAIYAARAGLDPLIIDGDQPGGQLMGTSLVENWPGEKSISGPILMQRMREQAQELGTTFLAEKAIKFEHQNENLFITTNKQVIQTDALIIATGATPRKLNCSGESEYWGKGVSTCAVCDGAFYKNRPIVIVGGGDTAMEEASFMSRFTNNITIIHILPELTASRVMQEKVINDKNISIIYSSEVQKIKGDGNHVTGIQIKSRITGILQELKTDVVFIAIGLTPNTEIFKGKLALTDYGYLGVKDHTKTSIEGVFAAGDVADPHYRQAITSASTGCMACLDAEKYLKKMKDSLH